MPSPDLLPKGRSFPSVTAPPLDDVLHSARRRRARQAGLVGAVTVAAVAAGAIAFVPHGSSQSLDVVTPAVPDHSATASPAPPTRSDGVVRRAPDKATATRGHGAPAAQSNSATTTNDTTGGTAVAPAPAAAPGEQPPASDQGTTVHRIVGPPHRMTSYEPTQSCTGSGPTPAQGWCSYYDGPSAGTAGTKVTLVVGVCRLPGQGADSLVSRNGRQADFAVGKQGYRPIWRWSHGRYFTQSATSIRVPAGTCVEWFVTWRIVDNTGTPLAPGKYYLDAAPRVLPGSRPDSAYTSNPITFTVR